MITRGMLANLGVFLMTFRNSAPFITGMNRSTSISAGRSTSSTESAARPFGTHMARYPRSSTTSLIVIATS